MLTANLVSGPADELGADFNINASSFALGGFDDFIGLGASLGHGLTLDFDPLVAGLFEQLVSINLFGENASGFHGGLGQFDVTLRINVQASSALVPLPVWLLGSALLGVLGARRRRV